MYSIRLRKYSHLCIVERKNPWKPSPIPIQIRSSSPAKANNNASHAICPFCPFTPIKNQRKSILSVSTISKSTQSIATQLYKTTSLASFIKLSLGQYGHLNLPPLLSLPRLSRATTCPHGIIIGGFASVVCSLLTGQTKMAWKMKLLGRAISTGNSFWVVHSVRFSFWMVASFRRVGSAIAPAVVAR